MFVCLFVCLFVEKRDHENFGSSASCALTSCWTSRTIIFCLNRRHGHFCLTKATSSHALCWRVKRRGQGQGSLRKPLSLLGTGEKGIIS
jgi:hypothetical protein